MNKKTTILILLGLLVGSLVFAKAKKITFAAGFKGGTYFAIGKSLKKVKKFKFKVLTTNGSIDNVKKVASGAAQLGMTQIDILSNSVLVSESIRSKVKVLLPLYREEVHVITKKSYTSLRDLKDKKVSVGEKDSGIAATANIIFVALKMNNKVDLEYSSTVEGLKKLESGDVDAVFIVAGAPVAAIKNLKSGYRLIPVSGDINALLTSDFFPYRQATISGSTYNWSGTVNTISVSSVIIANTFFSNKLARKFIKGVFKAKSKLIGKHPKWRELNKSYALATVEAFAEDAHPAAFAALQAVKY